jgi:hypothetical protein
MPGSHRSLRSATLLTTALLAVALAGCGLVSSWLHVCAIPSDSQP